MPGSTQPKTSDNALRTPERNTTARVAEARRQERVAELRRQRDAKGHAHSPEKADRPDVGRRRDTAEPKEKAGPKSHRRLGWLIGAAAVVVIAAVVAGVALFGPDRTAPVSGTTPTPSAPGTTSLLNGNVMLSPDAAAGIIERDWQIDTDQPGNTENAPTPACLDIEIDDALKPSDSLARTLTTTDDGPTALHRAETYTTPELATEAFALMAKALGECNLKGSYIEDARVISGIGDQATGIVLDDPQEDVHRSVVLNRTGLLVNVIDITAKGQTPDIDNTADALVDITDSQCTAAIGICASDPEIAGGPPPVGGDQPGFLALADIPLPKNGLGTWGGLDPGSPSDVVTTGCENVDFATLPATNRVARSYVLADNPKGMPDAFGLDQITLTMDSAQDAADTAELIEDNIRDCEDRLPTATVAGVAGVESTGADGAEVTGIIAAVRQQVTTDDSTVYRVGITSADNKVVYTFLSKEKDWDLTRTQWQTVTARAAERATQVR